MVRRQCSRSRASVAGSRSASLYAGTISDSAGPWFSCSSDIPLQYSDSTTSPSPDVTRITFTAPASRRALAIRSWSGVEDDDRPPVAGAGELRAQGASLASPRRSAPRRLPLLPGRAGSRGSRSSSRPGSASRPPAAPSSPAGAARCAAFVDPRLAGQPALSKALVQRAGAARHAGVPEHERRRGTTSSRLSTVAKTGSSSPPGALVAEIQIVQAAEGRHVLVLEPAGDPIRSNSIRRASPAIS